VSASGDPQPGALRVGVAELDEAPHRAGEVEPEAARRVLVHDHHAAHAVGRVAVAGGEVAALEHGNA